MDKRTFDALCRNEFSVFFRRAWRELEAVDYSHNWHIDCLCDYLQNVFEGKERRLIINVPPRTAKTLLVNIAFTAWALGRDPSMKIIGISYAQRLSEKIAYKCRILMETEWYKELFPGTELDQNQAQKANFLTKKGGGRFSTSVGGTLTGEGANILLVDDPMNPDEALSDVKRINANDWVDQAIYSRLNNPKKDKIVVIMQRLHDDDTTGHLLKSGKWTHVVMPAFTKTEMTYRPRNITYSYNGLLHEERLPKDILDDMLEAMGSYAFCTPAHTPITMADLSDKPIEHIKVGDIVLGYNHIQNGRRRRLQESIVTKVHEKLDLVYRYHLDNGDYVECTEDHEWSTGRSGNDHHLPYAKPSIGRKLMKVCSPIPELSNEQDIRDAAWLGGFFDGDGSAVIQLPKNDHNERCHVTFSQGTGRNIIICKKLSEVLDKFNITYTYHDRFRSDRADQNHKIRTYYLTGSGIEYGRFLLHVAQVTKWRERFIKGSRISRFIKEKPKIISKEYVGKRSVYGLTTTTGNYIAWGYASKNCGQYGQTPVPLGGGEFKSDFLNYYNAETLDASTCNLYITVDPATSKKKTSDYTAIVVSALAPDQNYYIIDGVRERLNPTERIERLFEVHRKWNKKTGKPPRVGYERYGMMSDIHYIEQKQNQDGYRFPVTEIHSGMQKEERIRRLIPIAERGQMWLPNNLYYKNSKGLPENFINVIVEQEILLFPFATHDDFLDAMAMIMDMNPIFPEIDSVDVHDGLEWESQDMSVFDL